MLGAGNIAFEIARRSLGAHMLLMDVVSHNIANVNTPGYTRQRGVEVTTYPFGVPGMGYMGIPGQIGTGVEVKYIERLRNNFLDRQFRDENGILGKEEAKEGVYDVIETMLQEPSDIGLGSVLSAYFDAWQELSVTPEDPAIRNMVIERTKNLISTFHHYANQLIDLRAEIDFQIKETVKKVNTLAEQIANLNEQIERALAGDQRPNDLMDKRDYLIDQLSKLVNVRVERLQNGGVSLFIGSMNIIDDRRVNPIEIFKNTEINASEVSDLQNATTKFVNSYGSTGWNGDRIRFNGSPDGDGGTFDGKDPYNTSVNTLWIKFFSDSSPDKVKYVALDNKSLRSGKLLGLIQARDEVIWNALEKLDKMAWGLASRANEIHRQGADLHGNAGEDIFLVPDSIYTSSRPQDLVSTLYAGNYTGSIWKSSNFRGIAAHIYLNPDIDGHPDKLAAARQDSTAGVGSDGYYNLAGDSTVAVAMAQLRDLEMGETSVTVNDYTMNMSSPTNFTADMKIKSTNEYFDSWVSGIGSEAENNKTVKNNVESLTKMLDLKRKQESGVNLDEEAADMIRYQKAYNAAARIVSVMEKVMDTIINLGRV